MKNFTEIKIYETFVTDYFENVTKEEIIILFDGYPITKFKIDQLRNEIKAGLIENWIEFDVFFVTLWEEKIKLGKRKLKNPENPKSKKRKLN